MKTFMGISGTKMASVGFLLAVLFITLSLGSITFLINDNAATLPNIGLEGNCSREGLRRRHNEKKGQRVKRVRRVKREGMTNEEKAKMKINMDNMKKNTENIPEHSKKTTKM